MRAAMAQRCFNPAGGRLSSLSMLRIPWETSWAALQPLVLQHEAVPWAGGTVAPPNPPGSLFPGAQPQSGPPSSSHAASLGWGLPPCGGRCGTGVAGGMCGGRGVQAASLQDTHPIFGRAGCVLGWKIFPKSCLGQGGKHRRCLKQSVPVCVWCGGCVCVCCLLARCKSCLWLKRCFVWIYRAMLMAGSPAPSPRTVFKDFPLQLRLANSCHWCSVRPHQPGSAPRSTRPCWKQEALAPGKLFKPNSKQ